MTVLIKQITSHHNVWLSSTFVLLTWFLWIGSSALIPQYFFLQVAEGAKEALLATSLFLGAVLAMLGVYIAQTDRLEKLSGYWLTCLYFLVSGLCFLLLFFVKNVWVFILVFGIFRIFSAYLYVYCDYRCLSYFSRDSRARYVNASVVMQMLGILAAPLYFALLHEQTFLHVALVPVMTVVAGVGLAPVLNHAIPAAQSDQMEPIEAATPTGKAVVTEKCAYPFIEHKALTLADRQYFGYAACILCVIYLYSAVAMYLARDFYGFAEPLQVTGFAMFCSYLSALLAVVFLSSRFVGERVRRIGGRAKVVPIVCLLVATTLLFARWSQSLAYICLGTTFIGIAYGMLSLQVKQYIAQQPERSQRLLASYSLITYAASIPFCVAIWVASWLHTSVFFWGLLVFIVGLLGVAFFLAVVGSMLSSQRTSEQHP